MLTPTRLPQGAALSRSSRHITPLNHKRQMLQHCRVAGSRVWSSNVKRNGVPQNKVMQAANFFDFDIDHVAFVEK